MKPKVVNTTVGCLCHRNEKFISLDDIILAAYKINWPVEVKEYLENIWANANFTKIKTNKVGLLK